MHKTSYNQDSAAHDRNQVTIQINTA